VLFTGVFIVARQDLSNEKQEYWDSNQA